MAKSTAKRKRAHQLRITGKDVTLGRNDVEFSTHVRVNKTKSERLHQQHTKYKKHFSKGLIPDGDAFYIASLIFGVR